MITLSHFADLVRRMRRKRQEWNYQKRIVFGKPREKLKAELRVLESEVDAALELLFFGPGIPHQIDTVDEA